MINLDFIQSSEDFFCDEKVLNIAEEAMENDPLRFLMFKEACHELNQLNSKEQIEFFTKLREEGEWQLLEDLTTVF